MRFLILFVLSFFSSYSVLAACGDQPANEVDWTNCNFVENLDLSGTGLANSQMSGVNLSLSNFEKSQLNNSNYLLVILSSQISVILIYMLQIYRELILIMITLIMQTLQK